MDNWIYCSDMLPDKEDVYLVAWHTVDEPNRGYIELLEFGGGEWVVNIPQAHGKEVVIYAWQEVPSAPDYEGGSLGFNPWQE